MLDNDLRNKFIDAVLKIPEVSQVMPVGRDALLIGLPPIGLQRAPNMPRLDLNQMIAGLDQIGRLDDKGGTRPLIVVAQNALSLVPESSIPGKELKEVIRQLEIYYGGEAQPAPRSKPLESKEVVIGIDERLRVAFFRQAVQTGRSVARLRVPRFFNSNPSSGFSFGTGWLIAPGLLITNHHVINARGAGEADASPADFQKQAEGTISWFDYHSEAAPPGLECVGAKLEAQSRELDYALIRLLNPAEVADRLPLRLIPGQPALQQGDRLNIVQHARGGPQQYAIRNNFFVGTTNNDTFLRYVTDTEPGASGSPVSDDSWLVLALHHAARAADQSMVPKEIFKDEVVLFNNEGIAIHKILDSLADPLRGEIKQAQGLS